MGHEMSDEAKAAVLEFAHCIMHGDAEYREWLSNAAVSFCYGELIDKAPIIKKGGE